MVKEEVILTGSNQIAAVVNDPKNPVKAGDVMYLKFDEEYPCLQRVQKSWQKYS